MQLTLDFFNPFNSSSTALYFSSLPLCRTHPGYDQLNGLDKARFSQARGLSGEKRRKG